MRFAIISLEGVSLWAAARLQDEGHDVIVYHAPPAAKPLTDPEHKHIGEGIVPIARTWDQVVAYKPEVALFDGSDYGAKADTLRAGGVPVIGSCMFWDRLEKERVYAMKLAEHCGMAVPEYKEFGSLTDSMAFVKSQPEDVRWFFKTDRDLGPSLTCGGKREALLARLQYVRAKKGDRIKHILQKGVDGIALSTAGYWNGSTFLRPWEGTLERKEFGNDDTGPKTGCSMNAVWFYPNETKVVEELHFDKLAEVFRRFDCPPGIVDVNAQLSFEDGKAYFLEFTPRYGYDAEPTASLLLEIEYGDFLARLAEQTLPLAPFSLEAAAMSIRLSVPPYPYEDAHGELGLPLLGIDELWGKKNFIAYGVRKVSDAYELADPAGTIGLSCAVGTDLEAMNKRCVKFAKDLDIADLGYRTDAGVALAKDLADVRKAGYPAPLIEGGVPA